MQAIRAVHSSLAFCTATTHAKHGLVVVDVKLVLAVTSRQPFLKPRVHDWGVGSLSTVILARGGCDLQIDHTRRVWVLSLLTLMHVFNARL